MVAAILARPIEHGTFIFGSGVTSGTVTLATALTDTSKSAVFMSYTVDNADARREWCRVEITNTTTLTFNKSAGGAVQTCEYYVAEWLTGVSVQRGTLIGDNTTPRSVAISAVTMANTFVIANHEASGSTIGTDDIFNHALTTPTNIEFSGPNGLASTYKCNWQAISYDDCNVQRGFLTLDGVEVSEDAAIAAVVVAKSFVITSTGFGGNMTPDNGALHGTLPDTTTVRISREAFGIDLNVSWEVVTFTDGTTVQVVAANMTDAETQVNDIISAVDLDFSIAIASGLLQSGGKAPYSAADNIGACMATLDLTSPTNLQSTRAITGSAALTMEAYVLAFPKPGTSRSQAIIIA